MRIDVVTIFPPMMAALSEFGVVGRALREGHVALGLWNPRDFTRDKHRNVDARPYGGGPGMVMQAEPIVAAVAQARAAGPDRPVIYLSPQGRLLTHARVMALAQGPGFVLLCGRYEGIDERAIACCVDEEVSIGDYVLSGGELAAMVTIDAVVRQLPGVLGDAESAQADSFVGGLLDYPHYTRPEVLDGEAVPAVLLSGDHAQVRRWRLKQSLGRTWLRRPDLLRSIELTEEQKTLLAEFQREYEQSGVTYE